MTVWAVHDVLSVLSMLSVLSKRSMLSVLWRRSMLSVMSKGRTMAMMSLHAHDRGGDHLLLGRHAGWWRNYTTPRGPAGTFNKTGLINCFT